LSADRAGEEWRRKGFDLSRPRFVALLVLTLMWGGVAHALAQDTGVDIVDFDYRPGSVTIKAGDMVTWTQSGEQPHTVTADDGSFDSGEMATAETFSMRFDSPGTYRYYCSLHGGPGGEGMSAVVIVEGAQASEEPPSVDDNGDGVDEPTAPATDASLPRTGGGPPAAWVFALALVVTGYVLARVARLSERLARR
jgi:plastocyanin